MKSRLIICSLNIHIYKEISICITVSFILSECRWTMLSVDSRSLTFWTPRQNEFIKQIAHTLQKKISRNLNPMPFTEQDTLSYQIIGNSSTAIPNVSTLSTSWSICHLAEKFQLHLHIHLFANEHNMATMLWQLPSTLPV